jgi:TonB-dependent receptor
MFLAPSDEHEFFMGLRRVDLTQTLFEFMPDDTRGNAIYIKENRFKIDEILPSFSYKYKQSDSDQFKFAFSQSFIYPDFREFSNAEFFHPDEVATIAGNPNLKKTDVTSYDLRYEHYFSPTESSSASIFYKNLDNPIEDTQKNSTSLPIYSYMNSKNAKLYGFEVDGYKNLSFINEDLENFFISGNYAYIISDVTLDSEQREMLSSRDRDLQGLSPYVVNLSAGYDGGEGRSVTVSYNKMAERLMKLGLRNGDDAFPDTYEEPPHLLDFVYMDQLDIDGHSNPIKFKFKVGNLLDSTTLWKQGDKTSKEFETGREFSLSVSTKF